jgi:hypothetical protein
MKEQTKRYRAPLSLSVLGSEIEVIDGKRITWKGENFPSSFKVHLMLEDKKQNSPLNWVVSFEVVFKEKEPFFKSVTTSGLGYQNLEFGQIVEHDPKLKLRTVISFRAPLEVHDRTELQPFQTWQLQYVTENLHLLRRVSFELVAKNATRTENGVNFVVGSNWRKSFTNAQKLEQFSKEFNEWQGRTLLTNSLLVSVAEIYQEEVLAAASEERKAKPAQVIAEKYGKPVGTANRWIAKAREEGLLPKAEQGKAASNFPLNIKEGEYL